MKDEPPFAQGTFLIDIGSHSIAAAHISRGEHGLMLKGATRREFTREALETGVIEKRIAEHFPRILKDMRDRYGTVAEVVLCLNGMFTVSQTRTEDVVMEGDGKIAQKITPENLRPAIQAGISHFFKEVLDDERNAFEPLDTALLATRLNGYDTMEPFGKCARTAGVTIHVAVAERNFHTMLRRTVRRVLPQASLTMHAATYALFRGLSESINQDDWLLVDTTGGISELGFVEDGMLRHVISLPDGGHALIEDVAKKTGFDTATVRSDLSFLARGRLEAKKAAFLRTQIRRTASGMAKQIIDVIDKPAGHPRLPDSVIVVAHPWVRSILSLVWEDPVYIRGTNSGDAPKQVVIDQKWLSENGLLSEEGSRDVFLGLLALGVSYFKSGVIVL